MRLWTKALGAFVLMGCIGAISAHWMPGGATHATPAEIQHNLETLRANADADLLLCRMKTRLENLNAEMGKSDAGAVDHVRRHCAMDREQDLEAQVTKVRATLSGSPNSLSLMKDWYATWQASIESVPADGSEIDTTEVDQKFNRLALEAKW